MARQSENRRNVRWSTDAQKEGCPKKSLSVQYPRVGEVPFIFYAETQAIRKLRSLKKK